MNTSHTTRSWFRTATALLSIPLLFGSLLVVYAWAVGIAPGQAYNSDQFHGFMLARDMLRNPAAVFDWYHSPAIYVVPDWLLAAIPFLLQVPDRLVPIFHGGMLLTLISIAGGCLLAASGKVSVMQASWAIAGFLVLFAGIAFSVGGASITPSAFLSLGAPVIHTGAILMALVSATLLIVQLKRRGGVLYMALLGAFGCVSSFSDFTYLVWFVAPACVLALLYSWMTRTGHGLVVFTVVVGSASAGVITERLVRQGAGINGYLTLVGPVGSVTALGEHLWNAWDSGDYAVMLAAGAVVALLLRSVILLAAAAKRTFLPHELIELFLGGSCACALLAPLLLGVYSDPSHWRYFLILFFLPLVWAALWLCLASEGKAALTRFLSPAVVALFSIVVSSGAARAASSAMEPSALEACLNAEGRITGLSDYWPAKLLMLNTSGRIHLVQVDKRGNPLHWNYNRRWFTERADGTPAIPTFIVLENLDANLLEARFGAPARSITCGGTVVWLYYRPLELLVAKAHYSASELPGDLGAVNSTSRTAAASAGEGGVLTYGPYIELAPGAYDVKIRYSATGSDHQWDATQSSARFTLAEGVLADTGGEVRDFSFELVAEQQLPEVEIRTFFAGSGVLTLYEIEITKRLD